MANLEQAYLAVTQRFRDFYHVDGEYDIALRPITAIDQPIIEHINRDQSAEVNAQVLQNQAEVSVLLNEVIKAPNRYAGTLNNSLSRVFKDVIDASETTAHLAGRYQDVLDQIEIGFHHSPATGENYLLTSLSSPIWEAETIEEEEFAVLSNKAEQDQVFIDAFRKSFGGQPTAETVKKVSFKKAELRVIRSWFDLSYLQSRNWRLVDSINGKDSLSTSAQDFSGALPAFIVKVILVKDIEVHLEIPEEDQETTGELTNGSLFNFGNLILGDLRRKVNNTFVAAGPKMSLSTQRAIKYDGILQHQISFANFYQPSTFILKKIDASLLNTTLLNPQTGTLDDNEKLPDQFATDVKIAKLDLTRLNLSTMATTSAFNPNLAIGVRSLEEPKKSKVTIKITDEAKKKLSNTEVVIRQQNAAGKPLYRRVVTNNQGRVTVELTRNLSFDIALTKSGFESSVEKLYCPDRESMTVNYILKRRIEAAVEVETFSDIQVLGFVYYKLDKSPNPIDNFQAVDPFDVA